MKVGYYSKVSIINQTNLTNLQIYRLENKNAFSMITKSIQNLTMQQGTDEKSGINTCPNLMILRLNHRLRFMLLLVVLKSIQCVFTDNTVEINLAKSIQNFFISIVKRGYKFLSYFQFISDW